jgi:hypothetical protein
VKPKRDPLLRKPRWGAALALAALFGVLVIVPFLVVPPGVLWLPLLLVLPGVIAPLESLLLTPLYTRLGRFHYFSPFLLATRSPGGHDLHVGTLYDYVSRLRWRDRGARARRIVLAEMLRGLLTLCGEVEAGRVPGDARIAATSYFFSHRSARRLGFASEQPPAGYVLNLVTASLGIALRLSFTHGRARWPDLREVRRITTTAERLLQHQGEVRRMLHAIERSAAPR